MNTVKLFSEAVDEVQYITEAKENGGKNYKIKGIFLQADIKTVMAGCILWKFLKKKLPDIIRNLSMKVVLMGS